MGRTVFSYRDAGMGSTDLHIQMRITDGVTNLLEVPSCRKHCKGTDKRNLTAGSKSCRNTCHITLCDTAVYMAVRKSLLKHACLGSACKVCIQHYQIREISTTLGKCITITFTRSDFLNVCH